MKKTLFSIFLFTFLLGGMISVYSAPLAETTGTLSSANDFTGNVALPEGTVTEPDSGSTGGSPSGGSSSSGLTTTTTTQTQSEAFWDLIDEINDYYSGSGSGSGSSGEMTFWDLLDLINEYYGG